MFPIRSVYEFPLCYVDAKAGMHACAVGLATAFSIRLVPIHGPDIQRAYAEVTQYGVGAHCKEMTFEGTLLSSSRPNVYPEFFFLIGSCALLAA